MTREEMEKEVVRRKASIHLHNHGITILTKEIADLQTQLATLDEPKELRHGSIVDNAIWLKDANGTLRPFTSTGMCRAVTTSDTICKNNIERAHLFDDIIPALKRNQKDLEEFDRLNKNRNKFHVFIGGGCIDFKVEGGYASLSIKEVTDVIQNLTRMKATVLRQQF